MICALDFGIGLLEFVVSLYLIDKMDMFLNYSMKKKVDTKKLAFLFPSNRANESTYGPSLEQPNRGTYLPAFICCCITYAISIILFIVALVIHFSLKNQHADLCVLWTTIGVCATNTLAIRVINEYYMKKYYKNQPYWIDHINAEIARRNIEFESNDQI